MVTRPAPTASPLPQLAMALLALLFLPPRPALAGTISGPGARHSVQHQDRVEDWTANDGALLELLPGAGVLNAFVNDSYLTATDAQINGLIATRGEAHIRGGTLGYIGRGTVAARFRYSVGTLDSVNIIATGTGIEAIRAGTDVSIRRSTLTANQIGVDAGDNAIVRLEDVQLDATSPNSSIGIRLADSRATIVDSRIQSGGVGVTMTNSEADIVGSSVNGHSRGLIVSTTPGSGTPARVRLGFTRITATGGPAALSSGASALILHDSHLLGSGSYGMGVLAQEGSTLSSYGSGIQGDRVGVRVEGGLISSSLLLDGTRVASTNGDALQVSGVRGVPIPITLRNGTTLHADNGVLLRAEASAQVDLQVSASHLVGDLVGQPATALDVTLRDGATLIGRIDGGRAVDLEGAQWRLTGDSHVGHLQLGPRAVLALGQNDAFHTLDISNDFTGNDGTLVFNTVLAGDDAPSDRLKIGGDTRGHAYVHVNNVGGRGAQTGQGIELISVGGASNGQFTLTGRAVGGQHEYFLHKGRTNDGNWYLRSELPMPPAPCVVDPHACPPPVDPVDPITPGDPSDPADPGDEIQPPAPGPVLRPEAGAYLANLQAAQNMFRISYHDRASGRNGGRAWVHMDGSRNGFEAVSRQLDIRGNNQALTVGADVWRHDSGSTVGVMLSSGNATSTSTSARTGYYARGKVKGESLGLYGSWRGGMGSDPSVGFRVDGWVQRAQFRNRVEGIGLTPERYDSRAWQGAVEGSYAFRVGGTGSGGIYLEPRLQIGYSRWDDYRHTEANGTEVGTDNADSVSARAGVRLSGMTRGDNDAVQVQPYMAANWLHTRAESQIRMDDDVVDAHIPRSRGEFSAGASLTFANGIGAWAGVALQKASGFHRTSAQAGVSYHW
ncbi:autotransporter outer membrane beta-barrel domain-containing protein [Stenotrophomonas maltophilia]|nr:autotransporter outer membrane beta-barrel domain-containing protein [Stenotrophomonas maltophilia]